MRVLESQPGRSTCWVLGKCAVAKGWGLNVSSPTDLVCGSLRALAPSSVGRGQQCPSKRGCGEIIQGKPLAAVWSIANARLRGVAVADTGGRPASPHLRGGYATTCVAHTWKEPQQHPERDPRSMGDADRRTNTQPLPPKGAIPRCAPRRLCTSRVPAVPVPAHWAPPCWCFLGSPPNKLPAP